MAFWTKKEYMGWSEYEHLVTAIDDYCWRQNVREKSIANL